ncbi:hypothetical protein JIQ42_01262 [Leishmania sp. Namibia]|uniref:hypothetical protein n=1 Tax=Leishmania sp. Namibia TaxID=2802991 RepID=UPI001B5667B6|nr:hypothetical protein JIQ42_01262 [Leishmania sp. Namibia]
MRRRPTRGCTGPHKSPPSLRQHHRSYTMQRGDLLGAEEPNKYVAQPALFRGSRADGTHAPLSSARQAAHDVRVNNRRGGDIQDPKAEAPPRGTPASSPASHRGSSEDDTYDTPVERKLTWRHWGGVARSGGARICDSPSFSSEKMPTMSQLVSAVDDVLGGSQRTRRSPMAASSFIIAPQSSCLSTEGASDRSCATNPSLLIPMRAAKVPLDDSYGTREARGVADCPPKARYVPQQREEESMTLPIVSTVTLTTANAACRNARATFCVFCGIDAPFGSAPETPPLCFSDGFAYHTACALWCPKVFYDTERDGLRGIAEASHRSRLIKCAWCRQPGAAVGCACRTCQLSFHVPCAVRARASMNMQTFVLYYPAHRSATGNRASINPLDPPSGEATVERADLE